MSVLKNGREMLIDRQRIRTMRKKRWADIGNFCHPLLSSYFSRTLTSMAILVVMVVVLLSPLTWAKDATPPTPINVLRDEIRHLQEQVAQLEEENQGLKHMLSDSEDGDLYLVVDTENNRLTMRKGNNVLLNAIVGTGSHQYLKEERGRSWYFESPQGSFRVLGRERNPVWIRPDWSYVEENMPIPPKNDPDRFVRDVLGKYAILLGNGYKIHGTTWKNLLGTHFTHGCISLGDEDLEVVHKSVKNGTEVYIY
jgi:hypothetical protein